MNLPQKKKTTNRRFYNKWLYKVTLHLQGLKLFTMYDTDDIKKVCAGGVPQPHNPWVLVPKDKTVSTTITSLCELFDKYEPRDYSRRVENSYMDIYTNDEVFYKLLVKGFIDVIKHHYEPDEEAKKLLKEDVKIIIADKYPHNRYHYRVYLLPHKFKKDATAKSKYIDWLRSQSPRITCTNAVERWIMKTDWNWDRRYVLVEDKNTLLLMQLRNPEVVGSVYEFVLSDK